MGLTGIAYADTSVNSAYEYHQTQKHGKENGFKLNTAEEKGQGKESAEKVSMNPAEIYGLMSNYSKTGEISMEGLSGMKMQCMEGRLTSGIIGMGVLEDGTCYTAQYASASTNGEPVIDIKIYDSIRGTERKTASYQISISQVDPSNATQLEMFALCAHADAQQIAGAAKDTYQKVLRYAEYGRMGDMRARNLDELLSKQRDWTAMVSDEQIQALGQSEKVDEAWGKSLQKLFAAVGKLKEDGERSGLTQTELMQKALMDNRPEDNGVPYYYLAKDGIIEYNGVVFVCDEKHKALHLGDTSDPKKCLTIPLSKGGCLIVNRDNIGDLSKAIGMFSPEDVKLILQAIAQDAKIQQMKNEIDEETSGIDLAEQTDEEGAEQTDTDGTEAVKTGVPNPKGEEPEKEDDR